MYNIGTVGNLIITKNLQSIIDSLHINIGNTEWSGILFYKLTKGSIGQLKDLEFKADFLYPMNIGNHSYTEFEYSGELVNAYEVYEEGIECSIALCHTHHNMGSFFSSTDTSELLSNAKHFNYYISLIVDFLGNYQAKIAFPSKELHVESLITDENGNTTTIKINTGEQNILVGDLTVIRESAPILSSWLLKRIEQLKTQKKVSSETSYAKYLGDRVDKEIEDYYNISKSTESQYKNKKTVEDFLIALITLDNATNIKTVKEAIDYVIKHKKKFPIEDYDFGLETNIDIIHQNIRGSDTSLNLDLIESLRLLEEISLDYIDNDIYDIIRENILNSIA